MGWKNIWRCMHSFLISSTVFPRIVSAETILFWSWPYVLWPLVTVHKSAETIQGRKLFKGGNYSRKYGMYTMNCICAWKFLYHYPSNLEIESPILLQLGYLNWQSSFGLFHFKIWWMICSQNSELISYFLHFVCEIIYKPIYFKPIDNLGPINNDEALPSPVKKWRKREKVWVGLEEFIGLHK